MAQKRAYALIEFGADDMLELARLIVSLGVIDREGVLEQTLGQPVAPDDIARPAGARGRESHFAIVSLHELQFRHAAQNARGRIVGDQRKAASRPGGVEAIDARRRAFLAENPDLFQKMIEANFVVS